MNRVVVTLARFWPLATPERPELRRALAFLDWGIGPDELLGASFATAAGLVAVGVTADSFVGGVAGVAAAGGAFVAALFSLGFGRLVRLLARTRRASALGASPAVLNRIALRMQLTPAPSVAARFAARTTPDPLAASLGGHVRRTANGPDTGLQSFAREWAPHLPEIERACSLVESASREPPADRSATLERARRVVLDAIQDRSAEFATSIKGPATALYAFGVLLPLSLVALLPALAAAGVPASLALVVAVYDLLLPTTVVAASAWLLASRPVAFRPTPIPRSHPDVPVARWHAVAVGVGTGALAWWLARRFLPDWTAPLAAVGFGAGVALIAAFHPMQSVRERVQAAEAGLPDAMTLLGRRVERGTATERALSSVATEITGPTGEVLADAARRQRRLGIDVATAFTGEHGAVSTLPSARAESVAALLGLAAREGRPAGEALTAMGTHLETLDDVKRESRRAVGSVTNTLSNTAAVFGPLVGGATVALTEALGRGGPLVGSVAVGDLGLAIGVYVLVLSVVLTALATGLTHGLDRSLLGYRVGLALPAATATYLTAFVGAGLVV